MAEYKQVLVKDGKNPEGLISFPIFITQREIGALNSFIVRDWDTFIVAYPKSGTTWMEQIVHLLANNGEQGDKILSEAVPWLEGAATCYGV
ncbi:sulfotransferase domain-containing protein [Cylindrospermum stagnale]|uniref:sulfotransferase domain-containing protein n=1 Tax=Cylindrospermum stagnale TaxID=142864 RepID=UPI0002D6DF12|nr:sulfotransferase domain-containing protein [Cylindrospermum stagnale]